MSSPKYITTEPDGLRRAGPDDMGQLLSLCSWGPFTYDELIQKLRTPCPDTALDVVAQHSRIADALPAYLTRAQGAGWLVQQP